MVRQRLFLNTTITRRFNNYGANSRKSTNQEKTTKHSNNEDGYEGTVFRYETAQRAMLDCRSRTTPLQCCVSLRCFIGQYRHGWQVRLVRVEPVR